MNKIVALKIEYKGKTPRIIELPVPLISKREKTGEVICDPIGVFPYVDGHNLLKLQGKDGPFRLVEQIYEELPDLPPSPAWMRKHFKTKKICLQYIKRNNLPAIPSRNKHGRWKVSPSPIMEGDKSPSLELVLTGGKEE